MLCNVFPKCQVSPVKKYSHKQVLLSTYFPGNRYSPVLISQEISTPGSTFFLGNKYSLGTKVLPYVVAPFQFLLWLWVTKFDTVVRCTKTSLLSFICGNRTLEITFEGISILQIPRAHSNGARRQEGVARRRGSWKYIYRNQIKAFFIEIWVQNVSL